MTRDPLTKLLSIALTLVLITFIVVIVLEMCSAN
jgi:hypothetical protein